MTSRNNDQVSLRYARDIHSFIRLGGQSGARAEFAGIVTRAHHTGGISFATVRDATGAIQIVLERSVLGATAWSSVKALSVGVRIRGIGTVGLTKRGETSIFASEVPVLVDSSLTYPISGSDPAYAALGAQMFQARLRARAASYFRDRGFLEIEPKLISTHWHAAGLEPLRVEYEGFGAPAYLAPTPATQLLESLYASGQAVFAASRCFSTTYRDEKSSAESLIVAAKVQNMSPTESRDILRDCIEYTFGDLHTHPESGLIPRAEWEERDLRDRTPRFSSTPVDRPVLEVLRAPSIARGLSPGTELLEIARFIWPPRRVIGEQAIEEIGGDLTVSSITVHIERMASLLRDLPLRIIRDLRGGQP